MTSTATAFAGARLLVVDDEVAQMKALCSTLEYEGYRPTGFSSAKQALAQLRPGEHELLLTDLMMPELDGIDLIRSARLTDPELAGIVMTGHGTIDTAVAAMQVGALDYVLKPFKLNVILTVIVRALDIRRLRIENAALQQRERERVAELAAAYRDLESFSYSVSHDLRSPLRTMNCFMDLFMEEFGDTVSREARSRLEQVRAGGARMDRLIDDLLKFCQFSRAPLTRQPVDLDSIVRRIVADLEAREPDRIVQIEIGELPAVSGDASLLEQVLVNLLSNAFKFTRHRAHACVSVGSFTASDPADPDSVERVYFVRDNGAGFDMKYAGKLFGVFQRLHSQDQFEGTGVGLSIVQRVLQRHGGRIWAESAPGSGAAFFFVLQVDAPQPPSRA
jgi:two-component system, sensor histidine kinase and response regulator